jgi:hypothetical protein
MQGQTHAQDLWCSDLGPHTRQVIVAARLKQLPHEVHPVVPVMPPDKLLAGCVS